MLLPWTGVLSEAVYAERSREVIKAPLECVCTLERTLRTLVHSSREHTWGPSKAARLGPHKCQKTAQKGSGRDKDALGAGQAHVRHAFTGVRMWVTGRGLPRGQSQKTGCPQVFSDCLI